MVTGVANFLLNLRIVVAEFSTQAFNAQVAESNDVARFAIAIPEALALMGVVGLALRVVYAHLPGDPGKKDFWDLMELRRGRKSEDGA